MFKMALKKEKEEKKKQNLYLIWKVRVHPVPNTAMWAIVKNQANKRKINSIFLFSFFFFFFNLKKQSHMLILLHCFKKL